METKSPGRSSAQPARGAVPAGTACLQGQGTGGSSVCSRAGCRQPSGENLSHQVGTTSTAMGTDVPTLQESRERAGPAPTRAHGAAPADGLGGSNCTKPGNHAAPSSLAQARACCEMFPQLRGSLRLPGQQPACPTAGSSHGVSHCPVLLAATWVAFLCHSCRNPFALHAGQALHAQQSTQRDLTSS